MGVYIKEFEMNLVWAKWSHSYMHLAFIDSPNG